MEEASDRLFWNNSSEGQVVKVCYLSGQRFWYQTAFCFYSLCKHSPDIKFELHVYDDGSIGADLENKIKKQFPGAVVHSKQNIEERLKVFLPEAKFPFLHHKRRVYPHIKKLTDVYAGETGYKLVLDSDMLFWKRPDIMINWLQEPDSYFHIWDAVNSYHYSFELMKELCGQKVTHCINVGAIGLKGEEINWSELESWARTMEEKEGSSYYLEQALSAMIIGENSTTTGAAQDYIVLPTESEIKNPRAVLHHYVDTAKEWYFRSAWRKIL